MKKVLLALALMLCATSAWGQSNQVVFDNTPAKQTGGSTGDSLIVAPDTSAVGVISKEAKSWWVTVAADSLASYKIQVSPNQTYWYTVDFDSCPKGEAELSANLGAGVGYYAGMYFRLILDNLTAAGAPYGRARMSWTKGDGD